MSGTSITIDWKTSKKGDKYYYIKIGDSNRCPIEQFDIDEKGRLLIFMPCVYYHKSMYDKMGRYKEGILGIIESLADYGKVKVVDDDMIPKLYGEERLMEWDHRYYNVVDGSIVLVWDRENSEAHLEFCVKE